MKVSLPRLIAFGFIVTAMFMASYQFGYNYGRRAGVESGRLSTIGYAYELIKKGGGAKD